MDIDQKHIFYPINIEDEIKTSYLDYAMSVIVSRAIPDVRDGLKPVHRRILYAMFEGGYDFNKAHKKSARIVGDVVGKYHPHGEGAVYDSLVRMAQDFSMLIPLVDGQGNFGSMDGDSPAAMRYTESRLAKAAHYLLADIRQETVDFTPNYDGSESEPTVLPAGFPNLLVNGSSGIAVGMATNIPPHNLGEVIDACCAYIENTEITIPQLYEIIKGPDFPTGGIVIGLGGLFSAYSTGRGSIVVRGATEIEESGNRQAIIITQMPYGVNKSKLIQKIAELVRDKKIEGISDIRDESNKKGVRVVIELKKDAMSDVILNQLYSFSSLQVTFGIIMLALVNGIPKVLNILEIISEFVKFREIVVTKRTIYAVNKARDRVHLLIGLYVAISNIDRVIQIIKTASDQQEARNILMSTPWNVNEIASFIQAVDDRSLLSNSTLTLTEEQTKAILEMRLQRLTGMEKQKLQDELDQLHKEIIDYLEILGSRARLLEVVKSELMAARDEFAKPRLTYIDSATWQNDVEALIPREEMVVTVTFNGYIKRVPLDTYKAQKRGGKGRSGLNMKKEDVTTQVFVGNTHTSMLFFSDQGKVYSLKLYKLPLGTPTSKGRPMVNLIAIGENERITNIMPMPDQIKPGTNLEEQELNEDINNSNDDISAGPDDSIDHASHESLSNDGNKIKSIIFATAKGNIRRNDLSDFARIPSNGKIAIRLDADDKLIDVKVCEDEDHILLATKNGKALRFSINALRVFKSRTSDGVRGIKLQSDDQVISMTILTGSARCSIAQREDYLAIPVEQRIKIAQEQRIGPDIKSELPHETILLLAKQEQFILTVSSNGFGKKTSAYEYRITDRGGSGILNMSLTSKIGSVIAAMPVKPDDELMLITDQGKLIRCKLNAVRISGRNTSGVILFKLDQGDCVVSVSLIEDDGDVEQEDEDIEQQDV
ncbi:DNA topoisomerase (ATP-hydrolyzing) subunit A [Candidatus Sarmatiella mevalonica]|uniref:DNA topoisomerase (ATP-hydrolyzing) subunit A n=1 Tax=Candidatus Sarmatiella mevalonica TaxID=2770581 RepID=UPI003977BD62